MQITPLTRFPRLLEFSYYSHGGEKKWYWWGLFVCVCMWTWLRSTAFYRMAWLVTQEKSRLHCKLFSLTYLIIERWVDVVLYAFFHGQFLASHYLEQCAWKLDADKWENIRKYIINYRVPACLKLGRCNIAGWLSNEVLFISSWKARCRLNLCFCFFLPRKMKSQY